MRITTAAFGILMAASLGACVSKAAHSPAPSTSKAATPVQDVASMLPANCEANAPDPEGQDDESTVDWDGKLHFGISCATPLLNGWTRISQTEEGAAGTTYVTHSFRKSGWMMVYQTRWCSSCELEPKTTMEPWRHAVLYPPAAIARCDQSPVCEEYDLCDQQAGWCAQKAQ